MTNETYYIKNKFHPTLRGKPTSKYFQIIFR